MTLYSTAVAYVTDSDGKRKQIFTTYAHGTTYATKSPIATTATAPPPLEVQLARSQAKREGDPVAATGSGYSTSSSMSSDSLYTIAASAVTLGPVLARGSPGVTLHKADLQLGHHSIQVAVKRLQTCGAPAAAESTFLKEMQNLRLASGTCHRACRLLGCCKLDGDACIVMTLYPKSAARRLEEASGSLPLQEVIGMGTEILEGLAQLHAARILHLDLKPGNILLDEYDHAYLSDFGISHATKTLEACTAVTSIAGTPHYMAPEQADADFGVRGTHSDVWGYAATLLHLASGQMPYADLSQMQMVSAMYKRRPPDVPASLAPWLRQMLQQCFSFDTVARPSVADLHKILQGQLNQANALAPATQALQGQQGPTPQQVPAPKTGSTARGVQTLATAGVAPLAAPLLPASAAGRPEARQIQQGTHAEQPPISATNAKGELLLSVAADAREMDEVDRLLSQGVDVNAYGLKPGSDWKKGTALSYAAEKGYTQMVQLMLSMGADVNAKVGSRGWTSLHCAALYGHRDVVELLLAGGANINAEDDIGRTALVEAQAYNHGGVVELLMQK